MNQELFLSHHFDLSEEEILLFQRFLSLFMEYNSHTNLSAIRDEEGIIEKHFIDSLYGVSVIEEIFARHSDEGRVQVPEHGSFAPQDDRRLRLLDIGSGGGFPGIPLKIVMPELHITLLDSVGKKVKAMNHFIQELGFSHITALQERAEVLAKDPHHANQYDVVVSRATAYITDILTWSLPFLKKDGKIILYKMPSDEEKNDREKITKKLGLILEGELEYNLCGKERVILVFSKR